LIGFFLFIVLLLIPKGTGLVVIPAFAFLVGID